jgi:hypothetical protein
MCRVIFIIIMLGAIFYGDIREEFNVEITPSLTEITPSLTEPLPLVTSSMPTIVDVCDPLFMLVVEVTTDKGMLVTFGMVPLLPHGKVAIQVDVVQTSLFGYDTTTTVDHATIVDYTTCDVAREVYLVCTDKRCIIRNISL